MKTIYQGEAGSPHRLGEHGKCRATRNNKMNRYE
jgi:hypothetical protein